ncbi:MULTISPECIES: RNA-binding domain-containing protein [Sphingobacterium]|nr:MULTISPECIES: RNA-binding domain-containing protein [Sphingobacterium]
MLLNKIIDLINSKSEGEYWDFKEKPYENNAALLHDILCLSNCLYEGERYLIIGITDPSSGCQLIGLEKNQANRKNQVSYIDFLRSIKFAGDNRPVLELKTLNLNGSEIDVLVIQNLPLKPYYITTSYRDKDKEVRANHIYSRTQDTNTPIDKSADINQIEKMWYQRFGLDLTPVLKMQRYLLDPNQWTKNIGNSRLIFHNTFPEYTIDLSEVEIFWEVYSYFFPNEKSYLGTAKFKFQQTELFELEYMFCDEMRIILPVPQTAYLRINDEDFWYFYYDKSSINGKFLYFLTEGNYTFHSRGSGAPFLLFKDEANKREFDQYILKHSSIIK